MKDVQLKTNIENSNESSTGTFSLNWFNTQAKKFEESRFALMAIYMVIQSCIASIACMYILKNGQGENFLLSCAAVAMASNSLFIAQADAKWCLRFFYLSLVVNIIFILTNI